MSNSGNEEFKKLLVLEARREVFHFRVVHKQHALMVHVVKIFTDFGLWGLALDVGH
jgi:hypothetical protein